MLLKLMFLCVLVTGVLCIAGCDKNHDNPPDPRTNNNDTSTTPTTGTLDKKKIVGWWNASKWWYYDGTSTQLDFMKRYFGADSFYYEENLGNLGLGSSTGKWWWRNNDSLVIQAGTGLTGSSVYNLRINKLTSDTLLFNFGYAFSSNYHKLDSLPITSRPISTIAGTGTMGFGGDNGAALAATFNYPCAAAIDRSGNIYIVDNGNKRVRKIDAVTGIIRTVAGNGYDYWINNGDGGPAINATLDNPADVVIDRSGNMIIADAHHNAIRKVWVATGIITTIAGKIDAWGGYDGDGGPAEKALLYFPSYLAIDSADNLFICDWGNRRIRKIDAATGIITTVAGNGSYGYSGDNGPATSAQISSGSIALDAGGQNLFLAENKYYIRKVSLSTGIITTIAGTGIEGYNGEGTTAASTRLSSVTGLAVDKAGNIFYSQAGAYDYVRKIAAADNTVYSVAGNAGTLMNNVSGYSGDGIHATAYLLYFPSKLCLDKNNNLIIPDMYNNRVRKVIAE